MTRNQIRITLLSGLALVAALLASRPVAAQDAKQPYPNMAPIERYLMDLDDEIALARSAAPDAIDKKELPALEQGTVSYMMSKDSYPSDYGGHNAPHIMFFETAKDGAAGGANLTNSTVLAVNYWYISAEAYPQLKSFPTLSVFLVGVTKWSDRTSALSM
jgi:hypothetical protein